MLCFTIHNLILVIRDTNKGVSVFSAMMKSALPVLDVRQQQTNNIVLITFWSQFSVYALNTILILFLTRPFLQRGLGYSDLEAYAFIGVSQATGYLMPVLGGFMADQVLGIRRSILLGSILLALAYLLVMLSGFTLETYGDKLFIIAYAMIPATNSLLMGTASSLVSHIYSDDAVKAKSAMTFYYMAINVGALLATLIAPALLDSRYGPLSVLALTFLGKSIAALNFAQKYKLYDPVIYGKDSEPASRTMMAKLFSYLLGIYLFTLFAYSHIHISILIISIGCAAGILWFFVKTLKLKGPARSKQLIALFLIIEAVIFFVIYNQMNSTLVLFAQSNSDLRLLGFKISPAHYQMLNPLLIIFLGTQLPRFYRKIPRFTIPYQFASGTMLAGIALLVMALAGNLANQGLVNGNFIGLTYVLITLAELWVSAIGLSMIGLYCDPKDLAFAMGVWYLASSLSNTIAGRLAALVAIPHQLSSPLQTLPIYQHYYLNFGAISFVLGFIMWVLARRIQANMKRRGIELP